MTSLPAASSDLAPTATDALAPSGQGDGSTGLSSSSALTPSGDAAQRAAHAGGLSLAPIVQGAPAPVLPRVGSLVRLRSRAGVEVYAQVLSATVDRVVVRHYGRPLAVTARSDRWRLVPDPWAPEPAPLPGEVCPSPTLPAEEVPDVG